jgi:hypothetical protein
VSSSDQVNENDHPLDDVSLNKPINKRQTKQKAYLMISSHNTEGSEV